MWRRTVGTNRWIFVTALAGWSLCLGACLRSDHGESATTQSEDLASTPSLRSPSAEETLRLIELKDVSIGHLESDIIRSGSIDGPETAARGFEQLVTELPNELLPRRNLAVARLMLLWNDFEDFAARRKPAQDAVRSLLELDPSSGAAHWVASQVELYPKYGRLPDVPPEAREKGLQYLRRATQLEPDNAIFWFSLYMACLVRDEPIPNDEATNALREAYAASPQNICLITEWLKVQSKKRDTQFVDTLTSAKPVLAPFTDGTRRHGIDLRAILDDAERAARNADWTLTAKKAQLICNLVRPEELARSDRARVDVHPLEFLLFDFGSEFYARNPLPEPKWDKSTSTRLVLTTDKFRNLPGVIDLRVMDFNLDGRPDVLALQPSRLVLLTQAASGSVWEEHASLDLPAGMRGMLTADLDGDRRQYKPQSTDGQAVQIDHVGTDANNADKTVANPDTCYGAYPDIVVFGDGGVEVVRNDCSAEGDAPRLVPVTDAELQSVNSITAGALVDIDHDSDLDLVLGTKSGMSIWLAAGKWHYQNISDRSQLPPSDTAITTMVAVDWDRDVDIDIVVSEPTGRVCGWLENLRHAEFRWRPFEAEYQQLGSPSCLAVLEADGNVSWDLLAAGQHGVQVALTSTPRASIVKHLRSVQLETQSRRGALTCDFDNDGYRDVAAWGEDGLSVWRGAPRGEFLASQIGPPGPGPVRTAQAADLDLDGDLDLLVATSDRLTMWTNEIGNENGWLILHPMGQEDNINRCNHHGIGSLVELRAAGRYQAQVVDSSAVHFGLGQDDSAELVRVLWTNGVAQDHVNVQKNVAICERMVLKSSCPYVYTNVAGAFQFFTDCLWAAPLGLQTSEGGVAPFREWEYLRIPGESLTSTDGQYCVQLTEELWEAAYFDLVQLIAVDHPADVEVYTNEKVGPPEIASPRIHTVRERRLPQAAVDPHGNDISAKLRSRDGDFVRAFDKRIRQGLTPLHFIELDLGSLQSSQQVTLFLTGWIYPTDTSLNVSFYQDPEVDGPRMPSVWVPDANAQWTETIAYMGFPGGKTKTIAVDLSKAFLTTDYRVRIMTTAEIYWDEAFFTVDEPPVDVRQTALELQSAELFYRGFSAHLPVRENSPRMYDAAVITHTPQWPAMRGRFTRFGDVTELLDKCDDHLAVIGSGDAITLRFAEPTEPVPSGWKRDFILHSVGWDKDADLNTIYGQTAEPLPFRAMRKYPPGPDETPPDEMDETAAAYENYLRRFQTREQNPQTFWRRLATP